MGAVELRRRDLLVALLGLPAALSACKRRAPEARWTGGFVDGAVLDGHRFRDGFRAAPSASAARVEQLPLVILGAGVAGLSAGWALRRSGFDRFAVLELEDDVGGTSSSGRSEVSAYPWGAHYLPAPLAANEDLVTLLEETKTAIGRDAGGAPIYDEAELCAAPKERVFFRGLWQGGLIPRAGASSSELEDLARFERTIDQLIGARDEAGRRAFAIPVAASSEAEAFRSLDRTSMAEWMERNRFTSGLVRWAAAYACRDDFGTEPANTSAWFGLHYFCARTERPGEESAEFLTWPEGNAFLAGHLAKRIGEERIHRGMMATGVVPEGDGRRARVEVWDRGRREARAFVADKVIVAVPSFLRGRLLEAWPKVPDYPIRTAPWLVANVHLSRVPRSNGHPPAWDNVIYDSRSLGYVDATHQTPRRPGGPTVWTYYLPMTGEDDKKERTVLEALSYEEASAAVIADLSRGQIDLPRCVERVDIKRWGHGMVRPLCGTAFSSARRRAAEPVGPLHFAHTDLSGVALFEEAFFHGVRAGREVLAALR